MLGNTLWKKVSSFSAADRVVLALCLAAIAYCLCSAALKLRRISIDVAHLARVNVLEPDISGPGFAREKSFREAPRPRFTGNLKFYSNWNPMRLESGATHTAWFKPVPHFLIFFAGYPNNARNQLFVEVQTAKAGVLRLPITPEFIPHENWALKNFSLPRGKQPVQLRISAVASSPAFWLGFSEPFIIRSVDISELCKQLLLCALTAVGSLVALLSPGLLIRRRWRRLSFIWLPVPGVLLLAFIGLAAWLGPSSISPRFICRAAVYSLIGYASYQFFRFPLSSYTTAAERKALFVLLLLVSITTAKVIYAPGPAGELNANRISRTFEVGARSDSAIPFHGVSLVHFRQPPFGAFASGLYSPWNYSHRGPVPSLIVSPLVLVNRVDMPFGPPDQPWSVFDPEGFQAYRIGMIVFACCGLLTIFGLARLFLTENWALLAFLIAATAPFTIHEIWFTWPKLSAACFVLIAAYLSFRRRYLASGIAFGFGYLIHPGVLVSFPAIAGIILLQDLKGKRRYRWIWNTALAGAGTACLAGQRDVEVPTMSQSKQGERTAVPMRDQPGRVTRVLPKKKRESGDSRLRDAALGQGRLRRVESAFTAHRRSSYWASPVSARLGGDDCGFL